MESVKNIPGTGFGLQQKPIVTGYASLESEEKDNILTLQLSLLEAIAREGDPLDILNRLCKMAEMMLPNSVASIMLLDESGMLNVYAAPNVPSQGIAQLNGLKPGPGAGSCGNAIYCQQPVFVSDTLTDPRWDDLRQLAVDFGLRACWSMPIRSAGQKVMGTFALSSFEHRSPAAFHVALLEIGAYLAGIVLDRAQHMDSLKLLGKIFEYSQEGIMVTDTAQHIVSVNRAFTEITGYALADALGKKTSFLSSGRHDERFYREMWRGINQHGHWQGEVWNRRRSGEIYPQWLSVSVIRDVEGKPVNYVGFISDITERKKAEARVEFLAFHDALTGLPNRVQARNHFDKAKAYADRAGARVALLFLDLDNFKTINDSLGHDVGDVLLEKVAHALKSNIRHTDTIFRYGGDEFLIQLSDVHNGDDVTDIAEKIIGHVVGPFNVGDNELSTTCSIGIALYPDDGKDFDTLLKRSDTAMYKAKDSGRNAYRFYTERMNFEAVEHLTLMNSLRRALEKNEFTLHYQPQMDICTGRVVGAEALIRWNHPELGMVPPSRFIPIAEESGVIVQMGEWVLQEACSAARYWPDIVMAVNLSAIQFNRPNFVDMVFDVVERSGVDPSRLEMELTESVLFSDEGTVQEAIRQLRKVGIRFSIDDFGTGYSNLAYLRQLQVEKLKIDRSFIQELSENPHDTAIVAAIIQMAKGLGLKTIAEGVEDEVVLKVLENLSCDEFQGFLFSEPLPEHEFDALLTARRNH